MINSYELKHGKRIFGAALVAATLVLFAVPAQANEYGSRYEERTGRFGELDWSRHPERRPVEQKEVIIYNPPATAGTTTTVVTPVAPPTVITPMVGVPGVAVPADSTVVVQTAMVKPIKINPDDRDTISNYMKSRYWHACPQGKIQNYPECAPHFRITRYNIGNTLPDSMLVSTLPQDLAARIAAPPPGFFYVHDQGNVFLIRQDTNEIVDVVPLTVRLRVD